jgi:hypothetical protein
MRTGEIIPNMTFPGSRGFNVAALAEKEARRNDRLGYAVVAAHVRGPLYKNAFGLAFPAESRLRRRADSDRPLVRSREVAGATAAANGLFNLRRFDRYSGLRHSVSPYTWATTRRRRRASSPPAILGCRRRSLIAGFFRLFGDAAQGLATGIFLLVLWRLCAC